MLLHVYVFLCDVTTIWRHSHNTSRQRQTQLICEQLNIRAKVLRFDMNLTYETYIEFLWLYFFLTHRRHSHTRIHITNTQINVENFNEGKLEENCNTCFFQMAYYIHAFHQKYQKISSMVFAFYQKDKKLNLDKIFVELSDEHRISFVALFFYVWTLAEFTRKINQLINSILIFLCDIL